MKRSTDSARISLVLFVLSLVAPPFFALLGWSVFAQGAFSGLGLLFAGLIRRPTKRSFIHGAIYLATAFVVATIENLAGSNVFPAWLYAGCAAAYWLEADRKQTLSCICISQWLKKAGGAAVVSALLLLPSSFALAQQNTAAGRWEGSVELPFMKLGIIVNLKKNDAAWTGTMNIPSQAYNDAVDVSIEGTDITVKMRGVPGDPIYRGKLSEDGRFISGELTQSGRKLPFKLERLTEAESAARQTYGATPEKGQPGVGIEGNWQGTIDAANLRLVVKISKASDGTLAAKIDSPDQGTSDLQVDSVVMNEKTLRLEIKRIGASFEGTIGADGSELSGTWEQQGGQLPLVFKRLGKK